MTGGGPWDSDNTPSWNRICKYYLKLHNSYVVWRAGREARLQIQTAGFAGQQEVCRLALNNTAAKTGPWLTHLPHQSVKLDLGRPKRAPRPATQAPMGCQQRGCTSQRKIHPTLALHVPRATTETRASFLFSKSLMCRPEHRRLTQPCHNEQTNTNQQCAAKDPNGQATLLNHRISFNFMRPASASPTSAHVFVNIDDSSLGGKRSMASSGLVRLGLAKALASPASPTSGLTSPTGVVAVFDRPASPRPSSGYAAASGTPKSGRKQPWLPAALRTPTKQEATMVLKMSQGSPAQFGARPASANASATKSISLAAHRGFPALAIQTADESAGPRFTQPKPASTPMASPKVWCTLIFMRYLHTFMENVPMLRRFRVSWCLPQGKTVTFRAILDMSQATATLPAEVSPRPRSARCRVMRSRTCSGSPSHLRRMRTLKCRLLTPRRATSQAMLVTCPIFSTRWVVRSASARLNVLVGTSASSMACARRPRGSPWSRLPSTSHLCQAAVNSGPVAWVFLVILMQPCTEQSQVCASLPRLLPC